MLAAAVCFAFGTGVAAGAGAGAEKSDGTAPTEQAPEVKAPPKLREIPEAERARIEKQLADAGEKLTALQEEELDLSIKVLTAESKALDHVEDRNKLKNALTKGSTPQDVVEYRNVMLACAQQWQMMDSKYAAVHRGLRHLDQKREEMPEDLKSSTEEVAARILKNRRSCLEKVAAIYDKLMDEKRVLAIYVAIYQMVPDDLANLNHMAAMYQKMGDYKQTLALYMDIHRQSPKDFENLRNMAAMYEKLGDYKKALEKYKEADEQRQEDVTNTTDLGKMYAKLGDYQQAVAAYDKVAKKISGNIGWEKKLAGLYEEAGALQKALGLYQKASEHCTPEQREKDENLKQAIDRLKRKLPEQ
jgi:tetratricopeptide (TPR) repeat protein